MKKTYKKALLVVFSAIILVTNASFAFANELENDMNVPTTEFTTEINSTINENDLIQVNQYLKKLGSTLQFTVEEAKGMLASIHPDGTNNWDILLDYAYGYENEIYNVSIIDGGIQIINKKFDLPTLENNLPMARTAWQVDTFNANFMYNVGKSFYSYGGYTKINGKMNYTGRGGILMRVTGPNEFMVDSYFGSGSTSFSMPYKIPSGSARVYWEKIPWAVDKNNVSLNGDIWFSW